MHSKQLAKYLTQIHSKKLFYNFFNHNYSTTNFIELSLKPIEESKHNRCLMLKPSINSEDKLIYKLTIFLYEPLSKTHTLPQEFTLDKEGNSEQIEQIYKTYFDWVNTRIKNNINKMLKESNQLIK